MIGTASGMSVTVVEMDRPMMIAVEAAMMICKAEPGCFNDATSDCWKVRFGGDVPSIETVCCCTKLSSVALDMASVATSR